MVFQFERGEIRSIIMAWVVLSVGITFSFILEFFNGVSKSLEVIVAGFIATATGFIFHEMGHKFVAMKHGYVAHFRIWMWGIILTLITAVVSKGGFLFGAPGAVYIAPASIGYFGYGYYSSNYRTIDLDKENMVISAAGPGLNLAFALCFYTLISVMPLYSFLWIVGELGFGLNVGLGSFNMLPISPLDGYKIFKKNIKLGLAIALPLWAMFLYFYFF